MQQLQDTMSWESQENTQMKEPPNETGESSDVVELNVGGEYMATLRSTLVSVEHSMLAAMFGMGFTPRRDAKGRHFIDRNPRLFRKILDFLRTGLPMADTSPEMAEELIYFGLASPDDLVDSLRLPHLTQDEVDWGKRTSGSRLFPANGGYEQSNIFDWRKSSSGQWIKVVNPSPLGGRLSNLAVG